MGERVLESWRREGDGLVNGHLELHGWDRRDMEKWEGRGVAGRR